MTPIYLGAGQWAENENQALVTAGFALTNEEYDLWSKDGVLFGRKAALQSAGLALHPSSANEGHLSTARLQLSEEEATFAATGAEGKALSLERAIEYPLSEEEERESPPTPVAVPEQQAPSDEPTGTLTRREQEVALLVGRGLTNHRIALELSISQRTVECYIGRILKKLGFASRTQIATWVAQR